MSDMELLQRYALQDSEAAFAELVRRHVDMLYSAALRKTGNPHAAEEVTQAVFIILAKKARSLRAGTIISGWLYQTARLTAATFIRGEIRRAHREQEAYMQSLANETEPEIWPQIVPLLEDAIGHLGEKDRNAVVLRFFERKSFQEIGAAFGDSENAAKKRVSRAQEKLRKYFSKRGIALTTAALAAAISANSVHAAPLTLAQAASVAGLAQGAASSSSTLTLIKGALKIMAWTKAKMVVAVGVGVLLAAGTTTLTVEKIHEHQNDLWQMGDADYQLMTKLPPQTKILPTKEAKRAKEHRHGGMAWDGDGRVIGLSESAMTIVAKAYLPYRISGFTHRVQLKTQLPKGKYDFISNLPRGAQSALQAEAKRKLGVVGKMESIETNVWLLRVRYPNAAGLKPVVTESSSTDDRPRSFVFKGGTMENLTVNLENGNFGIFVLNETGLTNQFDFKLEWTSDDVDALNKALTEQLGLELVPTNMPLQMLVVEKTN